SDTSGEHLGTLRTSVWERQCEGNRQIDGWMAIERHCNTIERFPVYSADWREQVWRRKHQKSRPAGHRSVIQRARASEKTKSMVRSEGLFAHHFRNLGKLGTRDLQRPRLRNGRSFGDQEYVDF